MSALSPGSGIQVSSVYPTYTLRFNALSVCVGGWVCVPLKDFFLVYIISNPEINIYFKVYRLKGGLLYNTDCFSYWQGPIQASYAVMRQLLFFFVVVILGHNLGNSQVSVYRTIGPTLVDNSCTKHVQLLISSPEPKAHR